MSKDILEAVYELERQKSIDAEVLLVALEDALKAAYKKTPEAARHVRVEIDRTTGEMKVFQVSVPDEILIEKGLLHLPEPSEEDAPEEPPVQPAVRVARSSRSRSPSRCSTGTASPRPTSTSST